MSAVLRPFDRIRQRVENLSRLKYAVVLTSVALLPMVFVDVFFPSVGIEIGVLIYYALVSLVVNYAAYSRKVNDWSFPTSWPKRED